MKIIAVMALLQACGLNNKINLFSTDSGIGDLLPELENAMNERLGCMALASDARDLSRTFVTIYVGDELTLKESGDKNAFGYYDSYEHTIYVRGFSLETELKIVKTVILHELGHAMGLGHIAGTIMDAKYKYNGPESIDIAEDSLSELLSKQNLNPCKK